MYDGWPARARRLRQVAVGGGRRLPGGERRRRGRADRRVGGPAGRRAARARGPGCSATPPGSPGGRWSPPRPAGGVAGRAGAPGVVLVLDVLMARSVLGHRRGTLTWRGRRSARSRPARAGGAVRRRWAGDLRRPPAAACRFDPAEMETRAFYRVLNSVVVPRPIAWVCSRSAEGVLNLAPHSFYTVACVDPPVVQFTSVGRKDSLRNVEATGEFTVSLTPEALFEQVNATGTDFPAGHSEAEQRRRPPGAERARRRPAGGRVAGRRRVHAALDRAARRQHGRLRPGAGDQRLGERRARRPAADRAPAAAGPARRQRVVDDRRGQGDRADPLPQVDRGPEHRGAAAED